MVDNSVNLRQNYSSSRPDLRSIIDNLLDASGTTTLLSVVVLAFVDGRLVETLVFTVVDAASVVDWAAVVVGVVVLPVVFVVAIVTSVVVISVVVISVVVVVTA